MPYWRHFYHLVWTTKDREPRIGDDEETVIRSSIAETCAKAQLIPHAIGMVADHVHVVVSIPPALSVADAVQRLKGASSHAVNQHVSSAQNGRFAWQPEYGSLTLGERSLSVVIDYVNNQKQHHDNGSLKAIFEQIQNDSDQSITKAPTRE